LTTDWYVLSNILLLWLFSKLSCEKVLELYALQIDSYPSSLLETKLETVIIAKKKRKRNGTNININYIKL